MTRHDRRVAVVLGRLDDSSRERCSGRWRVVAAKHIGIKIDITGPDDGAEHAVDGDSLEDVAVVADRAEHPAGLQQIGEVDLVHRAVGERQPKPLAGRDLDDRLLAGVDSMEVRRRVIGEYMRITIP